MALLRPIWGRYGSPSGVTWIAVVYAALYLIRPWEYEEALNVVPWERITGITLIFATISLLVTGRRLQLGMATIGLAGFFFFMAIAAVFAVDPVRSWYALDRHFTVIVFAACLLVVLERPRDLRFFLFAWVAIQFVYQAKAVWEHLVHGRGVYRMSTWRLCGIDDTWSDPNTFAATTVFLFPIVFHLWRTERGKLIKIFLAAETILAVYVVIKTGSRGGLLGLMVFGLMLLLFTRRRFLIVLLLGIAVAIVVYTLPEQLVARYQTILDPEMNTAAQESAEGRVEGLRKGFEIAKQRPLTGAGPGCFVVADFYLEDVGGVPGLQPHNMLGQLLGELGFGGAVVWLGFFLVLLGQSTYLVVVGRKSRNPYVVSLARSIAEIAVLLVLFGIVGHNLYRYNWVWIAALVDVLFVMNRRHAGAESQVASRPHNLGYQAYGYGYIRGD